MFLSYVYTCIFFSKLTDIYGLGGVIIISWIMSFSSLLPNGLVTWLYFLSKSASLLQDKRQGFTVNHRMWKFPDVQIIIQCTYRRHFNTIAICAHGKSPIQKHAHVLENLTWPCFFYIDYSETENPIAALKQWRNYWCFNWLLPSENNSNNTDYRDTSND